MEERDTATRKTLVDIDIDGVLGTDAPTSPDEPKVVLGTEHQKVFTVCYQIYADAQSMIGGGMIMIVASPATIAGEVKRAMVAITTNAQKQLSKKVNDVVMSSFRDNGRPPESDEVAKHMQTLHAFPTSVTPAFTADEAFREMLELQALTNGEYKCFLECLSCGEKEEVDPDRFSYKDDKHAPESPQCPFCKSKIVKVTIRGCQKNDTDN